MDRDKNNEATSKPIKRRKQAISQQSENDHETETKIQRKNSPSVQILSREQIDKHRQEKPKQLNSHIISIEKEVNRQNSTIQADETATDKQYTEAKQTSDQNDTKSQGNNSQVEENVKKNSIESRIPADDTKQAHNKIEQIAEQQDQPQEKNR